jgi:hypothetical protein
MPWSRSKAKVKAGPTLSDDRFDKLIAAVCWYVGRSKDDPEYVSSPFYYSAVWEWFGRLSFDHQELVHTVVYVYSTPGYGGETAAVIHAAMLPDVPRPPAPIHKAWGHG